MKTKLIFTLAFLLAFVVPASAQKKISDYPNTATAANTDLFILARPGSTNYNQQYQQLAAQLATNTVYASNIVSGGTAFVPVGLFPRPTKLVFLGDSITALDSPKSWAYELTNQFAFHNLVSWQNYAVSGYHLTNVWSDFNASIISNSPSASQDAIAFVMIGLNDIDHGEATTLADATNYWSSLNSLYLAIRTNGYKLCVLTITRSTAMSNQYVRDYLNNQILNTTNAEWIVGADRTIPYTLDTTLFYDGGHTTNGGSILLAKAVYGELSKPQFSVTQLPRNRLEWMQYLTDRAMMATNSNIGIGTETPSAKLEIVGASTGVSFAVNTNQLIITNGMVGIGKVPVSALDLSLAGSEIRIGNAIMMGSGTTFLRVSATTSPSRAKLLAYPLYGLSFGANNVDDRCYLDTNGLFGVGVGTSPTSQLHVGGPIATSVQISGAMTFGATNSTIIANADGVYTLPTAVGINGRIYTLKAVAPATTGVILTNATGNQLIDGATSYALTATNKFVTVQADYVAGSRTNWWIIGSN